ncbi:MAG: hypothetical protein K1060chlam1_01344 [Candidatus Anoxychlamydiales bacterium]|nr:hypothetical protein [Candidatus Anoxychlamydiales bacterium]
MFIFVVDNKNKPLMPSKPRKAKMLLKKGEAKVIKLDPFTIQLTNRTSRYTQKISLGVDAGTKYIGVSAATKNKVLFEAELQLRTDIKKLLETKKENRRFRRYRKTRYRKPRFLNRKRKDKWLTPSVNHKVSSHLKIVDFIYKILPITKIIIEVAQFDIQKIKNPNITREEYQKGRQLNFFNVREYILFRDNHICQLCKKKNKILNVHHIESRKISSNSPDNLITLCVECHKKVHLEKLHIFAKKECFKDASQITTIRWYVFNTLKEKYSAITLTYGYITKNTRIKNKLEKSHRVDARCIVKTMDEPLNYYQIKQIRSNNRRLHKNTILKGGIRKKNIAPRLINGFQLFDKVLYNNDIAFIYGRRASGYFKIATLDGDIIHNSISYKKLKLLEKAQTFLTIKRSGVSSPCLKAGASTPSIR